MAETVTMRNQYTILRNRNPKHTWGCLLRDDETEDGVEGAELATLDFDGLPGSDAIGATPC